MHTTKQPDIDLCSEVEPLSIALIREGNPHFEDNPITVFQFRAYDEDSSTRREYGYTHWIEVRARSEQFGNRECAAIYNYAPETTTRPNKYWPKETFTVRKGWSLGCN